MADALAHAHQRGLIHRDVKPKNIILTPQGVAKLTDLGLARQIGRQAAPPRAKPARRMARRITSAPNKSAAIVDIDFRADIYSLGATLYHLVTGRPPFEGETPAAVMHQHLRQPLIPADHVNTALSAGVGEIIDVAMAKRREDRYESTEQMLEDLRLVRNNEAAQTCPPGRRSGFAGEDRRDRQRRSIWSPIPPRRCRGFWKSPLVMMLTYWVVGGVNILQRHPCHSAHLAAQIRQMETRIGFIGLGIMGAPNGRHGCWRPDTR